MWTMWLHNPYWGSSPSPPTYVSKPEIQFKPFRSLNSGWRLTEKDGFVGSLEHQLVNICSVALCLNPQCQKRVPSKSSSCAFCGGTEISEFNTYTNSESLTDEISIENFHKVVKSTKPFIERTIINDGTKISFKSKLIVRIQYLIRKAFNRRQR